MKSKTGPSPSTGDYNIWRDGYRPEVGYFFEFKSEKYHFWFFAKIKLVGEEKSALVDVHSATEGRISIFPAKIDRDDIPEIERCIRRYFEEIESASRRDSPDESLSKVQFSWGVNR